MTNPPRFLIFCSDKYLLKILTARVSLFGGVFYTAYYEPHFWDLVYGESFDFILLEDDLSFDFFDLFLKLKLNSKASVLLISDNSRCLESTFFNIYDVLLKPFSIKSLDLKILSLLDLRDSYDVNLFNNFLNLDLYEGNKKVYTFMGTIALTKTEFSILALLLSQKNQVCHKSLILKEVWGYEDHWSFKSNIVEMHVSKLKKKLNLFFQNIIIRKKGDFFLLSFYSDT